MQQEDSWTQNPLALFSSAPGWSCVNVIARIYLLAGAVWALAARSVIPLGVMLVAALVTTLLLERQRLLQSLLSSNNNNNRLQSAALRNFSSPPQLQQQQQQQMSQQYPSSYRNPMPYSGALPQRPGPFVVPPDDTLKRLYQPLDEWQEGWQMNPIPDPTLTARQPFFWQSSEVDRLPWADQGNMRYMR